MTNRIITIDDIDKDDDEDDDSIYVPKYVDDIDMECGDCPYKWKCKIKKFLQFAIIDIIDAFELAGYAILIFIGKLLYPFVNLYNKHHGGIKCRYCHAYLRPSDDIQFCTHCGKPW